ncbi:MAG: ankyrin repeat protein [uncultured bacterium]|nr:MAG: ankyrin repeat protein [uncultured bacterium]
MSQARIPTEQDWLIQRMWQLKYTADAEGVCFGIAYMAVQALLIGEIDQFNRRLELIADIPLENFASEFAERINKIQQKQEKNEMLTEDDKLMLEIPAFFEGIELYQQPNLYPDWFEEKAKPHIQNAELTAPLIQSEKLAKQGGMAKISDFSLGIYTEQELIVYLNGFSSAIKNVPHPVALVLSSINHSITISYDPKKEQWYFINANTLPMQILAEKNIADLANKMMTEFSLEKPQKTVMFATEIYTAKNNVDSTHKTIQSWRLFIAIEENRAELAKKLLQEGADSNAMLANHETPLFTASFNGRLNIVKILLASGANPRQVRTDGATPLFFATQQGHIDTVKELLDAGATVDTCMSISVSNLLKLAKTPQQKDALTALLVNEEKLPLPFLPMNALHIAAFLGRVELVELLLKNGADSHQKTNGISARELAIAMNQQKIVDIFNAKIKQNNVDTPKFKR